VNSHAAQFSLRSLFYATAVLAVICGFVAWNGIGILFVIIPNVIAVVAGLVLGSAKRQAAAASLFVSVSGSTPS
jgi:hypothetical protein